MYKLSQYNIFIPYNEDYLIYNTNSSKLVLANKNEYEILKSNFMNLEEEVLNLLIRNGFIVEKNFDEFETIINKTKEKQYKEDEKVSLVIAPTLDCNYKCFYCFEQNEKGIMEESTLLETIAFIKNMIKKNNAKFLQITWFGGEPMLAFKEIIFMSKQIKNFCSNEKISFYSTMITNGSLFSENKLKLLLEASNLKRVQITLDGLKESYCKRKGTNENNYNRVIQNIRMISQYIPVSIRLNVDKENICEMEKLKEQILEKDCNSKNIAFYLARLNDYTNLKNKNFYNIHEFSKMKEKFDFENKDKNVLYKLPYKKSGYCGMILKNSFTIGPKGELYKCEHCIGDLSKTVGDVKNGIKETDYYNKFMNNEILKKCQKCLLFPVCAGGCINDRFLFKNKCNSEGESLESLKQKVLKLYLMKNEKEVK